MRPHVLVLLALALQGCPTPGQPVEGAPSPAAGATTANGGNVISPNGGSVISPNLGSAQAPSTRGPAPIDEDAAFAAVTMAVTEAVVAGAPSEGTKAEAPFTTLALGDRLASPEDIQAKLQGRARGAFQVDLTKLGTTTAVIRTSAEPTAATLVTYLGAGTEPLHGLSTEFRGVTVERAPASLRSQIAEQQGVVLLGGKNLFGQGPYAKLPFMKGAVAAGFGAAGTAGTQVSWRLTPGEALTMRYELAMTSATVPQVTGDFTLKLTPDQAAQSLTISLTGPYTAKVPGGDQVLRSGTVTKSKTTTLTEAKANFLAAVEALQGQGAK